MEEGNRRSEEGNAKGKAENREMGRRGMGGRKRKTWEGRDITPILISKIWHLCFPDYLPTLLLDPFTRFNRTPTCDRQMQSDRQLAMARTTLV